VIDGGTALTLTGVDCDRKLVGGAILPGITLQRESLAQGTASLPPVDLWEHFLPPRWAKDTSNAIASGILYSTLAGLRDFIQDWQQQFPASSIALTGGDGSLLFAGIQRQSPEIISSIRLEPNLILLGIRAIILGNIEKIESYNSLE
jgi:type III pantothenate kinase